MSEAHDAGADGAEDFDLSNVPMDDDADDAGQSGAGEGDGDDTDGEAADAKKAAAAAAERGDLPPEEVRKRYDSTRIALAEERRSRRELERRLEALERGDEPARRREPTREREEDAEIDPDVDPMGALKQLRAKVAAYEAVERQETQTAAERREQEAKFSRVEAALADHEADFRDEHPDYDEASKHYAVARAKELMGFGLTPAQIQPMLREEFVKLASTAISARKNPAAVVYELAKGRGFGKKAADQVKDVKAGEKNPSKLDALKRGERAASPLGGAGGRATTGLDVQTVANINIRDEKGGEAFDKAFAALERDAKRAERGR